MNRPNICLGDTARDRITGFSGVVVHSTDWLNGCCRIGIQPTELDPDHKPVDAHMFDIEQCDLVAKAATEQSLPPRQICLGDKVRDTVTGFTGVVVAITNWLYSTARITVQPQQIGKDGKPIGTEAFDIDRCVKLESVIQLEKPPTGGDRPNVAQRFSVSR